MKNKAAFLIVLLLCFLPSAAGYISYRQTQNAPVDESTAVTISIDDINGKNYTLNKENEGDEADRLIRFFLQTRKNAQPIVALPDSLMGEKFFKVSIATQTRTEEYEYYFSADPTANYFRAPDGTTYKIQEKDAAEFITSAYAESLYEQASIPRLTLTPYDVTPDTAVWQYKNYTGEYVDADVSVLVSDVVESYEAEGGLHLAFDTQPDNCMVKVTAPDGTVLFDDTLAVLSTFRLGTSEEVQVDVTATWYEDPARSFAGKLEYVFTAAVTAPAEFYLGMPEVGAGKFTAITAVNVKEPSKIQVASSLPDAVQPVFYAADENKAVAFLPVSPETPTGLYTLTFTYGGTSQDTVLTVEGNGVGTSQYSVSEAVLAASHTDAARKEFASTAETLMKTVSTERWFSGYFLEGINGSATLLRGFGRDIFLNGSDKVAYRNNGVDYASAAGLDVVACNAGQVVYAGMLDYAGNMVVIEHGYGLKTWYYNLGSTTVREGDLVQRGDKIGTTGQTGFTGSVGAHIAMSVGETFVCPYDTWKDSSRAGKVILPKIDE